VLELALIIALESRAALLAPLRTRSWGQEAIEGGLPENAIGEARRTLERIFRRASRR